MANEAKLDRFVFFFCLIDILFLPYAFFMAISYSFFVLMPWLFIRFNSLNKTERAFQWYILFSILVVISSLAGGLLNGVLSENISRAIQIIQIMGYYFLFSYYLKKYSVNIKQYLLWFAWFVAAFCVLYNLDKTLYTSVIHFWNPRGMAAVSEQYYALNGYRFSFVWMDPNNIAYLFVSLVAFLLINEKIQAWQKFGLVISMFFVLVSTMSSGGRIALLIEGILLGVVVFGKSLNRATRTITVKRSTLYWIVIVLVLSPLIIKTVADLFGWYFQTDIAVESMDRVDNNSMDSRIAIWTRIIQNANFLEYLLIGYGGSTFLDGIPIKPHNGHFYMIMAYGFIAYFILMHIMFRKRKITPMINYIWIVAVFLGFTVNVLVGEVKLSALIMLMVACTGNKRYLTERGHIRSDE